MKKLHIRERVCTSCSERVRKCVRWCTQHLFNVNVCACMVLRTPVWMHATLPTKNAHAPMHARPCDNAETSLPWKLLRTYLESFASIVQLFAARPPAVSTKSVARRCSLKKFVKIYAGAWRSRCCDVAQALFGHVRWCRPFPVVYDSHSRLAADLILHKIVFPLFVSRAFEQYSTNWYLVRVCLLQALLC